MSFEFSLGNSVAITSVIVSKDGEKIIVGFNDGGISSYKLIRDRNKILCSEPKKDKSVSFFKIIQNQIIGKPTEEKPSPKARGTFDFTSTMFRSEKRLSNLISTLEENSKGKEILIPTVKLLYDESKDYFIHYNITGVNLSKSNNKTTSLYTLELIKNSKLINHSIVLMELCEIFSLLVVVDKYNNIYLFNNNLDLMREIHFNDILKVSNKIISIQIDILTGDFVAITDFVVVLFNVNGVIIATLNLNDNVNIESKITCGIVKSIRNTQSDIYLFTGHFDGNVIMWRVIPNSTEKLNLMKKFSHILSFDSEEYYNKNFIDSYRLAYNRDYYRHNIDMNFEFTFKFDNPTEFHQTRKSSPVSLIKFTEDNSTMITVHDDLSLNYW